MICIGLVLQKQFLFVPHNFSPSMHIISRSTFQLQFVQFKNDSQLLHIQRIVILLIESLSAAIKY
jgi:hypothetical protein